MPRTRRCALSRTLHDAFTPHLPQAPHKRRYTPPDQAKRQCYKKHRISHERFDSKRNHLGGTYDKPPDRQAVEEISRRGTQKRRKADLSVIDLIKQQDHGHAADERKRKILKKNHDPEHTAWTSRPSRSQIRQTNTLQARRCPHRVRNAEKDAGDAKRIINRA